MTTKVTKLPLGEDRYISPEVMTVDLITEGLLCLSGDSSLFDRADQNYGHFDLGEI